MHRIRSCTQFRSCNSQLSSKLEDRIVPHARLLNQTKTDHSAQLTVSRTVRNTWINTHLIAQIRVLYPVRITEQRFGEPQYRPFQQSGPSRFGQPSQPQFSGPQHAQVNAMTREQVEGT
ncbi:hypothetical protein F511_31856 [Dorcoceras hygrometricum]|uniref:Uncharacterized protein n=1 Tax=Dorcoceras hygrometricum TaxID=472368 RepID=A0A2Z7AFF9_9LAMI|nr:hypothetical protein F511_31856 [Dorcoceras hygrometricum]